MLIPVVLATLVHLRVPPPTTILADSPEMIAQGRMAVADPKPRGFRVVEQDGPRYMIQESLIEDAQLKSVRNLIATLKSGEELGGDPREMDDRTYVQWRDVLMSGPIGQSPSAESAIRKADEFVSDVVCRMTFDGAASVSVPLPSGSRAKRSDRRADAPLLSPARERRRSEPPEEKPLCFSVPVGTTPTFRSTLIAKSLALLSDLRKPEIDRMSADLERIGRDRLRSVFAGSGRDGLSLGSTMGGMDPGLQAAIQGNGPVGNLTPESKLTRVRFVFLVGIRQGDSATMSDTLGFLR